MAGGQNPEAKILDVSNCVCDGLVALDVLAEAGEIPQAKIICQNWSSKITLKQQNFLLFFPRHRDGQIRGYKTFTLFGYGTGNEHFLQRTPLPKLTQAQSEQAKLL
jgi:hypothetical protein